VHQRHEPHVHVELLVAVKQREAGLCGQYVDLNLLPRRNNHDILQDA